MLKGQDDAIRKAQNIDQSEGPVVKKRPEEIRGHTGDSNSGNRYDESNKNLGRHSRNPSDQQIDSRGINPLAMNQRSYNGAQQHMSQADVGGNGGDQFLIERDNSPPNVNGYGYQQVQQQ